MDRFYIDSILEPLGFAVTKQSQHNKRFEGFFNQRRMQIHYQRLYNRGFGARIYVKSQFQVFVDTPQVKTQVQIGPYARVLSQMKKASLEDPAYTNQIVMGLEPGWVRELALNSATRPHIVSLNEAYQSGGSNVAILINPGTIQIVGSMTDDHLTSELARQIIEAAAALGEGAESLPANYTPVEATSADKAVSEGRLSGKALIIVLAILGGLVGLAGCCVAAAFILTMLQ